MDLYHLQEEAEPSDRTALESVVDYIKKEIEVRPSHQSRGAVRALSSCLTLQGHGLWMPTQLPAALR